MLKFSDRELRRLPFGMLKKMALALAARVDDGADDGAALELVFEAISDLRPLMVVGGRDA